MNDRQHPDRGAARSLRVLRPSRKPERTLARCLGEGSRIAGIDEAGRGPLAGPVVAAAVVWPDDRRPPRGLNDSKQVPPGQRVELFQEILAKAHEVGVGLATAREIDVLNILEATRLASRRALEALPIPPAAVLTDALTLPGCPLPVEPMVKGDCRSVCIAAASIVAKVIRDRLMDHYANEYPGYSWETNRGYATGEHVNALERLGPSTLHRLTFAGVGFFSEHLCVSRTFRKLWGEGCVPDCLRGLNLSAPTRAWALQRRPYDGMGAVDAGFESFLSRAWAGSLGENHRLPFLDEQELAALHVRMRDAAHHPPWLA